MPGEAFMDTMLVNGCAYPTITLEPKAYRFRILSICNDRFLNLQLYVSGLTVHAIDGGTGYSANPTVTITGGGAAIPATAVAVVKNGVIVDVTLTNPGLGYTSIPTVTVTDVTGTGAVIVAALDTEVKMVDAVPTPGWPVDWPIDGRVGGVPDPATAGPDWIQIGTEGGFLPKPVVVPTQPVTWNANPTTFNFGNVLAHSLLLGSAERADVIVDFSAYAGKTLILYNDAPAAFPALDTRYDYFTNNPDQTTTGGSPKTMPGYGPNIRTVMQIKVLPTVTTPFPFNLADLQAVWARTAAKRGVFEVSQEPILIPDFNYDSAYNSTFALDAYIRQHETAKTFQTISGATITIPLQPKAMQDEMGEVYDVEYGRMQTMLGLELPVTVAGVQNFFMYPYDSPPVDVLIDSQTVSEPTPGDGTQIWKITHNGVDTHTIHFHLFNVQLINRVAWDGAVLPPDENELGWKETIRVNPLEHTIVAMRPIMPTVPFQVPNSVRPIAPSLPLGTLLMGSAGRGFADPNGNPVTVTNHMVNFGHEYVYHCHILAHEEMDMMHATCFAVGLTPPNNAPTNLLGVRALNGSSIDLTWSNNTTNATNVKIERAESLDFLLNPMTFYATNTATAFTDNTALPGVTYYYRVKAANVVGDTMNYETGASFPVATAETAPSNTVTVL
jgi:FtsP/CotA-like multicopper oxidase with cupredoxin domain